MDAGPRPADSAAAVRGRLARSRRASAAETALAGAVLLLWSAVLRLPTFSRSVIDWDESLYMLAGREWLAGHLPGTVVWDHKPPGVHALFAAGLAVVGEPVAAMRVLSVLFVALGGLALYGIGRELTGSRPAGLLAAGLFAPFLLGLGGLAANTELFFVAFELFGLRLLAPLLHGSAPPRGVHARFALAGLLFGCAFQVKYLAAFETSWFALAALAVLYRATGDGKRLAGPAALLALGAALPSAAVVAAYASQGRLDLWLDLTFRANRAFGGLVPAGLAFPFGLQATAEWAAWALPLLLPAGVLLLFRERPGTREDAAALVFLAGYLLAALGATWATRRFYPHYFLPTVPAACLLVGHAFARLPRPWSARSGGALAFGAFLSLVPVLRTVEGPYRSWWSERRAEGADAPSRIAAYLRARLGPGERIWVVNDEPVLYLLTGSAVPTRYVFPPFLTSAGFSRVAGVDVDREVRRIAASRPAFLVVNDDLSGENTRRILSIVLPGYEAERAFGRVTVYRARGRGPNAASLPPGAQKTSWSEKR